MGPVRHGTRPVGDSLFYGRTALTSLAELPAVNPYLQSLSDRRVYQRGSLDTNGLVSRPRRVLAESHEMVQL